MTIQGELLSADVCGPFKPTFEGKRYVALFKDNYSRYRYVYLLKEKSEVECILTDVIRKAKALGHVVHEFLSDNGGEFDNEVRNVLNKNGISSSANSSLYA